MEPKLRFKEFCGEWEETILNKVCKINPKTKEIPNFFYYIDLESVVNGKLLKKNNLIDKKDAPSRAQRLLKNNDVLYQTVRPYQKNNYYFDISEKSIPYIASTGYAQLRTSKNNSKFIFQEIHNDIFVNAVLEKCTGTSYPAINSSDLGKVRFTLPSLPEQTKIADFLSTVDKKIQNQQDKITHLENIKKGFMQNIFSRKIRFKDDEGNEFPEWEEKKIGELDIFISDGNYGEMYPKNEELLKEGVPFIRANNIKNLKLEWNDMKYISYELHSSLLSGHLKEGDILITTRGDIGLLAYVNKEFENANINAQICLIRVNKKINSKYLIQYLSSNFVKIQLKKLQTGSALKQLPKKNLYKIKIELPCLEEQQKIADFLSSFDEKIDAEKETLEHLKELKKGLLQQMFV